MNGSGIIFRIKPSSRDPDNGICFISSNEFLAHGSRMIQLGGFADGGKSPHWATYGNKIRSLKNLGGHLIEVVQKVGFTVHASDLTKHQIDRSSAIESWLGTQYYLFLPVREEKTTCSTIFEAEIAALKLHVLKSLSSEWKKCYEY